jgi:tRNA threonylcarbamoyl adenosine modification protein YjeE
VISLGDDAATAALGQRLAQLLRPGDLVALRGDLGAGKTALARSIVRTLTGDPALEVPSPTFALVQPYEGVLHADLYRISTEAEAAELGLDDQPDAIVLVEWPERAPDLLARASVVVDLTIPPDSMGRLADIAFRDDRRI